MAKIMVDSEQFNIALQLFNSGKDKLEEADFRYKNLKNEFDLDAQLQVAPEFLEIEEVCQQMDSIFFRLREQVENLSCSLTMALQGYEETERKAEEKIKQMKNRCETLQSNVNDEISATLTVEKEQNEELKNMSMVSQMVQNNSFDLSMASTATVSDIINKDKKVETIEDDKVANDVRRSSSNVSMAGAATMYNEQNDKKSEEVLQKE